MVVVWSSGEASERSEGCGNSRVATLCLVIPIIRGGVNIHGAEGKVTRVGKSGGDGRMVSGSSSGVVGDRSCGGVVRGGGDGVRDGRGYC